MEYLKEETMDKSRFLDISRQVLELAQNSAIPTKTLKTYAGVLLIASGTLTYGLLSSAPNTDSYNTSPYKPEILQNMQTENTGKHISFSNLNHFLSGDGSAGVFSNPFANNETITMVHSDNYKTLADLDDPDKWAAKVAALENVSADYSTQTLCSNNIDWDKPAVSLSGKCLTIINMQQADQLFADISSKSGLSLGDIRLFVLLHEAAHGQSTTRSMSALHKKSHSNLYRKGFAEKQADLSAFFALTSKLEPEKVNALFDVMIKHRSDNSPSSPDAYDTHGILVIAKKLFNEDPDFFKNTIKDDILFKATLMTVAYNEIVNKEELFPNYQSNSTLPASIHGLVQRLQSQHNSESKSLLMEALDLKHDQVSRLNKTQLTDIIMANIDSVNDIVAKNRTVEKFDDLINNDVHQLSQHIDTSKYTRTMDKLIGAELDTPSGYQKSIEKVAQSMSMDF
jgi:hypothetical protein